MANNKHIRGLSGRGFRVKNSAGNIVTVKEGVTVQVDLENRETQDILSRERDNFIRVPNASSTDVVLKPLSRNGIRITPRSATVTISNASPAVVTFNAHGLKANDALVFATTGSLPAPLVSGTVYYVRSAGLTNNTFTISLVPGGSAINTTSSGSGTHTAIPLRKNVGQDSDVTVNVDNPEIRRILRRHKRDFVRLASANSTSVTIVGLTEKQTSVRALSGISRGTTASISFSDPANFARLRRHFRAWVEN